MIYETEAIEKMGLIVRFKNEAERNRITRPPSISPDETVTILLIDKTVKVGAFKHFRFGSDVIAYNLGDCFVPLIQANASKLKPKDIERVYDCIATSRREALETDLKFYECDFNCQKDDSHGNLRYATSNICVGCATSNVRDFRKLAHENAGRVLVNDYVHKSNVDLVKRLNEEVFNKELSLTDKNAMIDSLIGVF